MVSKIVLTITLIAAVAGIIVIVKTVLDLIGCKGKGKKIQKILSGVLCFFLIIITVADFAIYRFNNVIDIYFNKINMNSEEISKVRNEAKKLTEKIEGEGMVLLKNNNDVLPIEAGKINVFGYSSLAIAYGGSGSGAGDESENIDLYTGLKEAGFEPNTEIEEYYRSNLTDKEGVDIFHLNGGDYNIYEPSQESMNDSIIENAKKYSDVAVVVISRNGGEGGDLPTDMADKTGGTAGKSYLELADAEEALIDRVSENFDKVIILINSGNPMEMKCLDDDRIDAAIWIGNPGSTGCRAVAKALTGEINPSGRLADTWAYDVTNSPAYYNSGDFRYPNTESKVQTQWFTLDHYLYLDYQEGIYVGYRYYETRWLDNATGECDEKSYHEAVQYPFGYGLSYTDFEKKISDFSESEDAVAISVEVKNTGSHEGKDVVEIYNTAPYYAGGIEKAGVVLVDYRKTKLLKPGESQTIEFEIPKEELASYDYEGIKAKGGAYVLEKGTYKIRLMENAHDEIESREINVAEDVIYNDDNSGARSTDMTAAVNHFDNVSKGNEISYVTRADWEKTDITERPQQKNADDSIVNAIENPEYPINDKDEEIVIAKNGLTVDDMKGLDYDDPAWDKLLQQLSVSDMVEITGFGGFATAEVKSVGKYKTTDTDGPAGINGLVNGASGVQYTSEVTLASTWNQELAEEMGDCLGKEAHAYKVSGIYAPAMNIHREPFGGRNFEYYSEDGVLAGRIAAGVVRGINSNGLYCYIKHFALDNQETNRENVCVWCNEQAMREVYFKAFELSVKEGGAKAVMDADSRIGTEWCGACSALNEDVLRNEWGFKGMVITDYIGDNFKDADIALYNGCDLMLSTTGEKATKIVTGNNSGQQQLRRACHNILYTIANSDAQELSKKGISSWILVMAAANIIFIGLIVYALHSLINRIKNSVNIE